MRGKSRFVCAALGVALAWSVAGQVVPGVAGDKRTDEDPRLAQLSIRLLGTSS